MKQNGASLRSKCEWDLLTVVPDKNMEMEDARDVLNSAFAHGDVVRFGPAGFLGQGIDFAVRPQSRAMVVDVLVRAGFRIVEGGQR
jgi:hypothetical protein